MTGYVETWCDVCLKGGKRRYALYLNGKHAGGALCEEHETARRGHKPGGGYARRTQAHIGYDNRGRPVYEIRGKAMVPLRPGVYLPVGSRVKHFECQDCRGRPGAPMLKDALWADLGLDGVICTACLEKRMGRPITNGDLTRCPMNDDWIKRTQREKT
jgi:hypothetical protein